MIRLEVQCMNHDNSRLNMLCNARQLIALDFILVEYSSSRLKIGKTEHRLALTVFDENRDTGKCMMFEGFVVVAFKVSVFIAFQGQSVF